MICESALLKEDEWESETRDGVGAATQPKEGWQTAVREKMRGKDVYKEKDRESD